MFSAADSVLFSDEYRHCLGICILISKLSAFLTVEMSTHSIISPSSTRAVEFSACFQQVY